MYIRTIRKQPVQRGRVYNAYFVHIWARMCDDDDPMEECTQFNFEVTPMPTARF